MTAHVTPDPASPCFGLQSWPERPFRVASVDVVDNGDGTVTASAVPFGGGDTVDKTVTVDDVTRVKGKPGPAVVRWRVVDSDGGDVVFTQKAMAEARADAINERGN